MARTPRTSSRRRRPQPAPSNPADPGPAPQLDPTDPAPASSVNAWEDDPLPAVLVSRPVPDLKRTPLAFGFPAAPGAAGPYQPGTAAFRYWTAAEALRRGADFWATRVPLTQWEVGASLKVILDEGQDLNAYYDRQALNFFHGPSPDGTVYSGESPDIVCHEMGHAVLDSFKPELWDAGNLEVAAFHESFADISAILSAIQLPSLRTAILASTGGKLYQSSRLSRLAEQLGAAIRAQAPDAVDPDCLRNAVNTFTYSDPIGLPSSAPASQLSSEPHSFSRLFTAAFFETLGVALTAKAQDADAPTEAELLGVANDLAGILVAGIKAAPVVSNWYAQVAASMVLAAESAGADYPAIIKSVYVRRAILSLNSAADTTRIAQAKAAFAPPPAAVAATRGRLPTVGLPATHVGIEGLLFVAAPIQARPFLVTSAAANAAPLDPANGSAAAQAFVDDLFTRGRIDTAGLVPRQHRLDHGRKMKSHRLVKVDGGARLDRVLFDCGFCLR